MGKTNKANRTKGNTRPSSSGHSAQLLSSSGKPLPGFIGFGPLDKETASYVPVTGQQVTEAADSSVDSEFRMVMRKVLKRDAVTRLKAVQEFGELCVEKDKDIVKNVLPFWPRLFNRLALDTDRRIREATHHANGKLLTKVRREMAPYLKNVMGVWLMGQCDTHPPAQSAAITSFSEFPPPKQAEALMFCRAEVFAHFKDNLFEQTVKSMSEPNPITPEEMENKYNLVISATLLALKLFISTVQPSDHAEIQEDLIYFVSGNKFWKFAKHKEPQIRGAWYALIGSLCQFVPGIFNETEKKLVTNVLGSLSESDPVVAPAVWEAALSVVVNFESCWQEVDIHKVVLPQLWSLLAEGGRGNATLLFPCLLPFLSKLPKDIVEKEEFLLRFFSCFRRSLLLHKVKSSPMECDAILVAFMECLQFMCLTKLNEQSGLPLLEKVIADEIIPILRATFIDPSNVSLATSKFYPLLGALIRKLEQKCQGTAESGFSHVLDVFWTLMIPLSNLIFELKAGLKLNSAMYLCYFYNTVISSFEDVTVFKKKSVRFNDEAQAEEDVTCRKVQPQRLESGSLSNPETKSFPHIATLCNLLCQGFEKETEICYLKLLEEILGTSHHGEFLHELVKKSGCDPQLPLQFFQKVVLKWLRRKECADCLDSIVDLVFVMCTCMPKEEAFIVLDSCCKESEELLRLVLEKVLESHEDLPFLAEWLQNPLWTSQVVNCVQQAIEALLNDKEPQPNASMYMLNMCVTKKPFVEHLLLNSSYDKIILLLKNLASQIFSTNSSDNFPIAIQYLCSITTTFLQHLPNCWKSEETTTLVSLIFNQSLNASNLSYSDQVRTFLFNTWQNSIKAYIRVTKTFLDKNCFILGMATTLHSSILSLTTQEQAFNVLQHCQSLLQLTHEPMTSLHLSNPFADLMVALLPSQEEWNNLKKGLHISLLPSIVNQKIFYPLAFSETSTAAADVNLERLSHASEVVSAILNPNETVSGKGFQQFLEQNLDLHAIQVLWYMSFCKNGGIYSEMPDESKLINYEKNCIGMLSSLPENKIQDLAEILFKLSLSEGPYWSLPFQIMLELYPKSLNAFWINKLNLIESPHKYITQQILIPYLPVDSRRTMLADTLWELHEITHINNEKFAGNLGVVCCYLQNDTVQLPPEMCNLVTDIIRAIFDFQFRDTELQQRFYFQATFLLTSARGHVMSEDTWDSFNDFLGTLFKACVFAMYQNPQDIICLYQTATLYKALTKISAGVEGQVPPQNRSYCMPEEMHSAMVTLFIRLPGIFTSLLMKSLTGSLGVALPHVQEAIQLVPRDTLLRLCLEVESSGGEKTDLLQHLMKGLVSDIRPVQFAAHSMLFRIMEKLPDKLLSIQTPESEDDSEEDIVKIPSMLLPLMDLLEFLNDVVESMLQGIKIGDVCTIVPHTDSFTLAMAYLLAWTNMLQFIAHSPSQVRLGHAAHLEKKGLLTSLFSNAFCLMPHSPVLCLKKAFKVDAPKKDNFKQLFLMPPVLLISPMCSEQIQAVACFVFAFALRKVPASIRTWWNNLDRKSSDIVNNFTAKYISSLLCNEEIQAAHDGEKNFKDMVVQARPGTREVIATYTVDECSLELSVQLPVNHPLGPIVAERRGKVVIGQLEWRHWLMQLTTLLTHQNGSIVDGLQLWRRNLEKKFEGVEECMICYYVLHTQTLRLPKLSCHVCRKKFHSTCLYKWFSTSNKSTCPLCRNEFVM